MSLPDGFALLYDETAWSALGNCDCACPTTPPVPLPDALPGAALRLHPGLRLMALDDNHSVAYVPSHSRVVVINDAARRWLATRGEQPRHDASAAERECAELCLRLGLLTSGDGALAAPPPADTLVAWLHVTNACNLRCTYCYVNKTNEAMDQATGDAAVAAALRAAVRHGYRQVLLKYAGGEASLNLPLVERMHHTAIEHAAAQGIQVTGGLLSNGAALTSQRLAVIRRLGLRLMISLDGMGRVHDQQRPTVAGRGSFAAALAGIERALAAGITPDISITVTSDSIHGLPDLLRWVLARELPFSINFYRSPAWGSTHTALRDEESAIIAGMRRAYAVIADNPPRHSVLGALLDRTHLGASHARPCGAGDNYLVVGHTGQISLCQMDIANPITSVTSSDPLMALRDASARQDRPGPRAPTVDEKEGCRSCEWRYWCAGGCPVETYRATGRSDIRSPNCAIYKALYPDVIRLEGLRLLRQGTPA